MVGHRVEVEDLHAHLFRITLTLPRPAAAQEFSLPVWAPGSLRVRDFVRHLSGLVAYQGEQACRITSIDKSRWRVEGVDEGAHAPPLVLRASVYAFDPSVHGAFLDTERGFFNGSSLFLRAEGRADEPQRLQLGPLPSGWQVATAMREVDAAVSGVPGVYEAADYDELIDHPFELGRFWRGGFEVAGVPHEMVVSGAWPGFDGERLLADTRRICATQVAFWHRQGKPPFRRYVFLLQARDAGCAGLEHRDSCALVCARRDLPRRPLAVGHRDGVAALVCERSDSEVDLLGLISHEYFHAWNAKRLQPLEFVRLDLERENPSRLLWFFEGFTAYYDQLLLCRAGLIDAARWLRLLARPINALRGTPGRRVQSVAQASFDAWARGGGGGGGDRADENTPNATVSCYVKGALVALLCDLRLRALGPGRSLDELMRRLWQRHGDGPPGRHGNGLTEVDIEAALASVAGVSMQAELQAWVHGTDELPLRSALEAAGVRWTEEALPLLAGRFGLRLSESALTGVQVRQVLRGSAGERAGIAAGDELLAIDGWRLRRFDDARAWWPQDQPGELLLSRDGRLHSLRLEAPSMMTTTAAASVTASAMPSVTLSLAPAPPAAALAIRQAWLGA